jgi:tRNA-modifying protein YgfZ
MLPGVAEFCQNSALKAIERARLEREFHFDAPFDLWRECGHDCSPPMLLDQVALDDLGVLRIRGTDALTFLQGQLSNDLERLEREGSLLAGLHNPQGRAIAVLRLLRGEGHDVLAVLPRELAASVAQRLGRYVLRSKVHVSDESSAWRLVGIARSSPTAATPAVPSGLAARIASTPELTGAVAERWIIAMPHGVGETTGGGGERVRSNADARRDWRLLDIAAGLPQVYASTSEQFVAQMLNLDLLDAISFSKGCYTGQEVIARAHYRGRIKRRMQRWLTSANAALVPGESARLADGRTLRVVDAAQRPDGRCELLAVAPFAAGADDEPAASADKAVLEAEQLPLPYDLPA